MKRLHTKALMILGLLVSQSAFGQIIKFSVIDRLTEQKASYDSIRVECIKRGIDTTITSDFFVIQDFVLDSGDSAGAQQSDLNLTAYSDQFVLTGGPPLSDVTFDVINMVGQRLNRITVKSDVVGTAVVALTLPRDGVLGVIASSGGWSLARMMSVDYTIAQRPAGIVVSEQDTFLITTYAKGYITHRYRLLYNGEQTAGVLVRLQQEEFLSNAKRIYATGSFSFDAYRVNEGEWVERLWTGGMGCEGWYPTFDNTTSRRPYFWSSASIGGNPYERIGLYQNEENPLSISGSISQWKYEDPTRYEHNEYDSGIRSRGQATVVWYPSRGPDSQDVIAVSFQDGTCSASSLKRTDGQPLQRIEWRMSEPSTVKLSFTVYLEK